MRKNPTIKFLSHRRINPQTACWEWTGYCMPKGYGMMFFFGKMRTVHRVAAYVFLSVPLDTGMRQCVLHRCDNPPCFNPDHLFLGTAKDNAEDSIRKGRFERCLKNLIFAKRKLSDEQLLEIRQRRKAGATLKELGESFSVSQNTVFRGLLRSAGKE